VRDVVNRLQLNHSNKLRPGCQMLTAADKSTEPDRRPGRLGFFYACDQTPECTEVGCGPQKLHARNMHCVVM
jgi:hypothetical protein